MVIPIIIILLYSLLLERVQKRFQLSAAFISKVEYTPRGYLPVTNQLELISR